jgi:hypothetical protein
MISKGVLELCHPFVEKFLVVELVQESFDVLEAYVTSEND